MKRLLLVILALLLLAGCSENIPVPTTTEVKQTTAVPTTEPDPGIYVPDSETEKKTDGGIREYRPGISCGLAAMGSDVVLFSWDKDDTTTLIRLTEENCRQRAKAQVNAILHPKAAYVRFTENAVGYYDKNTNSVVILNAMLQEQDRVVVADQIIGDPVLSEDLQCFYYMADSGLRVLDMNTGISRTLRQCDGQSIFLNGLCMNGAYLQCTATGNTGSHTEFISAKTGQVMDTDTELMSLESWADRYYLVRRSGTVMEQLFSLSQGELIRFVPKETGEVYPMLPMNGALVAEKGKQGITLCYYDLESGHRTAKVSLPGFEHIYNVIPDAAGTGVWFLAFDYAKAEDVLFHWALEKSLVKDQKTYTTPRYTRENPDTVGLQKCRNTADKLEQNYGVRVVFGDAVKGAPDYEFVSEFQVEAIEKALSSLKTALSRFPEGFFKTMTKNGCLEIGIVRSMEAASVNVPDDVDGLQYWIDGNAYMALAITDTVEQTFYHELCHVLETFVYTKSGALDDWEKLNPKDFTYDWNYTDYLLRGENAYISGDTRAFIDNYSMTYATEDRARILQYAITEGNEECFQSEIMQKKLRQLCIGIREAYGWKKDSRDFLWEQYLKEPLSYKK